MKPQGLAAFYLLVTGITISALGSYISAFAVGLWVYERSGSVSLFSLVALATMVPPIVVSSFSGILADRWDRRSVIVLAQAGGALTSAAQLALYAAGALTSGAIILLVALATTFLSISGPAVLSSVTLLVPATRRARANGLAQLCDGLARTLAPTVAVVLLGAVGLGGVFAIDVGSFAIAIGLLFLVRIPRPTTSEAGRAARGSALEEATFGFRYTLARPGLLGLLILSAVGSATLGVLQAVFTPLVLSFTSARALGVINSVSGLGLLAGSGLMLAWGGPRRRVDGAVGFTLLQGALCLLAAARPSAILAGVGAFGILSTLPLAGISNQTIWQRKVPPDVQGRVFSARGGVAQLATAAACLAAGPLSDRVFEPAMRADGVLAARLGGILGVGPGRGVALLLVLVGALTMTAAIVAYAHPRVRGVEHELPDEDVVLAALPRAEARSNGS